MCEIRFSTYIVHSWLCGFHRHLLCNCVLRTCKEKIARKYYSNHYSYSFSLIYGCYDLSLS